MKFIILPLLVTTFLLSFSISAQVSIGFKAGPNYTWYLQTKSDYLNKTFPGWGVDAGLVLNAGYNQRISFRSEFIYSMQSDSAEIDLTHNPNYGWLVVGKFYRHNLLLSAQGQLNMLRNKNLFLSFGPYMQYTIGSSGNGDFLSGYFPEQFSGNDVSRVIFAKANIGATIAIGIQKIRVGKVSFFGEIRESAGFISIYKEDFAKAEWIGCITTVAIGIEFYRSR